MASDFEKPDKVHTLFPDEIPIKMWPLPVRDLLFLGKASEKKLTEAGIHTIGDMHIPVKRKFRDYWETKPDTSSISMPVELMIQRSEHSLRRLRDLVWKPLLMMTLFQ